MRPETGLAGTVAEHHEAVQGVISGDQMEGVQRVVTEPRLQVTVPAAAASLNEPTRPTSIRRFIDLRSGKPCVAALFTAPETRSERIAMSVRSLELDGVRWSIWDVRPICREGLPIPGRELYEGGWLSFDGGEARRRITPVPEGWEQWGEAELREAIGRAIPIEVRV